VFNEVGHLVWDSIKLLYFCYVIYVLLIVCVMFLTTRGAHPTHHMHTNKVFHVGEGHL
jgi:hypothetical protein